MTPDVSRLADISAYLELIDRLINRAITAPEFEATFLHMMKSEQRSLGEPIYPLLQELFENADAYVERPEVRTAPKDLDDKELLGCASRTRQALREIGFE
jgi:hypothetical protein